MKDNGFLKKWGKYIACGAASVTVFGGTIYGLARTIPKDKKVLETYKSTPAHQAQIDIVNEEIKSLKDELIELGATINPDDLSQLETFNNKNKELSEKKDYLNSDQFVRDSMNQNKDTPEYKHHREYSAIITLCTVACTIDAGILAGVAACMTPKASKHKRKDEDDKNNDNPQEQE